MHVLRSVTTRTVLALAFGAAALAVAAPAAAQSSASNPITRGWNAAKYGNCRADLLVGDPRLHLATATIGALSASTIQRLFPKGRQDDIDLLVIYCAEQLNQHRCSNEIVAALGAAHLAVLESVLGVSAPPTSLKDPVVTGAVVGGAVGGTLGLMHGRPISGALKGAAVGAAGAGAYSLYKTYGPAAACLRMAGKLNEITAALQGTPMPASGADIVGLIEVNVRNGQLSDDEANMLRKEVAAMSQQSAQVVRAMAGP